MNSYGWRNRWRCRGCGRFGICWRIMWKDDRLSCRRPMLASGRTRLPECMTIEPRCSPGVRQSFLLRVPCLHDRHRRLRGDPRSLDPRRQHDADAVPEFEGVAERVGDEDAGDAGCPDGFAEFAAHLCPGADVDCGERCGTARRSCRRSRRRCSRRGGIGRRGSLLPSGREGRPARRISTIPGSTSQPSKYSRLPER